MEKFIEKLGLYDIWTILFPGMLFICGLKTLHKYIIGLLECTKNVDKIEIYYPIDFGEIVVFMLISYLCGHILHEASSIAKKIIYKKEKPTELLLEPTEKVLNYQQVQMYMPMFIWLNNNEKFSDDCILQHRESKIIFDKMNIALQLKNVSSKFVKLNIIYNTCMTLSITILLLQLYIMVYCIILCTSKQCIFFDDLAEIIIILIPAFYLLLHRSKRYYIYWVKNIVAAYANLYEEEFIKKSK